jgi:hypothetical protein
MVSKSSKTNLLTLFDLFVKNRKSLAGIPLGFGFTDANHGVKPDSGWRP